MRVFLAPRGSASRSCSPAGSSADRVAVEPLDRVPGGRHDDGVRRLPVVLILLAGSVVVSARAEATHPIQPGAMVRSSEGQCTLNFVYKGGGGKTYIGTAAHCVDKVGDQVRDEHNVVFGRVAALGDPDDNPKDWALIEVNSGVTVLPWVKGHPDYPTGVTSASETVIGDPVQMSGYGVGFGLTGPTREERVGELTFDNTEEYDVVAPAIFGDSGGPVVHIPTGKALGIISRLCFGSCTETGPTVQGIIAKVGFSVTLRTA